MCARAGKKPRDDATDHQEGKICIDAHRLSDEICDEKLCKIMCNGSGGACEKQKMSKKQSMKLKY